MDLLDRALLFELMQNCRVPYSTLAKKHSVSLNTVKNRIQSLVKNKIILRFVIQLNLQLFNTNIALLFFEFTQRIQKSLFNQIGAHKLVGSLGLGIGADGVAQVYYKTNDELNEITEYFHNLEGLKKLEIFSLVPEANIENYRPLGTLDDLQGVDWLILYHLRYNGRLQLNELAQKIPLSARTIQKRLNFMRKKKIIVETIQISPVFIKNGLMVLFKVELEKLTNGIFNEIEGKLRRTLPENYWVTWQVVDRPILMIGFQAANAQEIGKIHDKLLELLPMCKSIDQFLGESMEYFDDFRDEILEENKEKWFKPELWERKDI
ncbi:MAG: AsnC family transcriptional regulator [Candidatus Hodarchaeota archaeon]